MARPALSVVSSLLAAWDAVVAGNFTKIGSAPFPLYANAALTEATVQATFPAASYDQCLVWVNHTVNGYTLYMSDGTTWYPYTSKAQRIVQAITAGVTLSNTVTASLFTIAGVLPYTVILPTAASMKGRTLTFVNLVAGTSTLDGSGAELINGAATKTITVQYDHLALWSDGTAWYTI